MELPSKFIKDIGEEEYRKFFQNDLIVKDNSEISFSEFKLAFEKKVVSSEKETREKIIETVIEKMPFLSKLSDVEIDMMIETMNTPQGYAMREIARFLLENMGDIMDSRAEKIALSCFDLFIEFADLNKRIKDPGTSMMN